MRIPMNIDILMRVPFGQKLSYFMIVLYPVLILL